MLIYRVCTLICGIDTNDIITVFDKDIFDALIDYIIVGGYDENEIKDQYLLRFICKSQFKLTNKNEITREEIISKVLGKDKENGGNIIILDFIHKQCFPIFEKDEKGKITKSVINNVRVKVEFDII